MNRNAGPKVSKMTKEKQINYPSLGEVVHLEGLGDDIVVEADVVLAMAAAVYPWPGQFRHLQPI